VLPFADAAVRAVALDDALTAPLIDSTVRAVRAGGRVVGPVSVAVPGGVTELARDERSWVAERRSASGPSPIVQIARAKS
jgi:hypothetical protein